MTQIGQPDGSTIITLSDRKTKKRYELKVKDLYGENEEVLYDKKATRIPW